MPLNSLRKSPQPDNTLVSMSPSVASETSIAGIAIRNVPTPMCSEMKHRERKSWPTPGPCQTGTQSTHLTGATRR